MVSSSFIILSSLLSFALGDLIPPNSSDKSSNASFSCPDIRSSSDSSSSSHSCDSSSSSDFCSSSSSSEYCDPCCSGVRKLTYQASFDAGIYLSKITQKFTPCDVFGQGDFCFTTGSIAYSLGVDAVLVGSDGLNACSDQILDSGDAITGSNGSFLGYTEAYSNIQDGCDRRSGPAVAAVTDGADCRSSITGNLPAIEALVSSLIAFQHYPIGQTLGDIVDSYLNDVYAIINAYNLLYAQVTPDMSNNEVADLYDASPIDALNSAITDDENDFSTAVPTEVELPYGTYYDISRAWALNKPTYSIIGGIVSAANSIYDCYGDYRAIYLTKPLSQMPYIKNSCRRACFECCNDKSRSCTALCGGLKPPGFNLPFKI